MLIRLLLASIATGFLVFPAQAQEREVPYWATLRYDETNMRVGPSQEYKIEWVYRRKGLPVKVVRVMEGWRLIRDHEGTQGWVAQRQLNPSRGAVVVGNGETALRAEPKATATIKWRMEPGVVGRLGDCDGNWCEFAVGNRAGYVLQNRIWGAGEP